MRPALQRSLLTAAALLLGACSDELPLTEKEIAAATAAIKENAKAFECIDNAMKRKGVDWRIVVSTPAIQVLLPHLNEVRTLANLVNTRAMLRYQQGDHAGALADMKRVKFIADAVEQPPVMLITHLVGVGCNAILSSQLQRMAPELKVDILPEWIVAQFRARYPAYGPLDVFYAATTAGRSWRGT